ncbi:DNA-directed DNA/RNA polymerase mu isoform 1-T1 [Clarias gariepinus]|uniref:DNA-directed DNA/RNA polymerase mu isoform X1 n=1 Tax=Clarias gariepinus TaxID=13013 RepID=UPI00234D6F39|nr:DNA-directed DNA/RNA polymerase mu isoform X1 [Clarias gariepinus]
MIPLKRRKVTTEQNASHANSAECKFPDVAIFIVERKMGASRKSFLTRLARSKGFLIEESYSSSTTHVVSENNTGDEVEVWIKKQETEGKVSSSSVSLLDISWLTESMARGSPVPIQDRHRLKTSPKPSELTPVIIMKSYACQRRTPLKHHNLFLTEALEVLAENAEFSENEGRSVAFRRSSSVLKALPYIVRTMQDLKGLPCLGDHSLRVIKEILEDGTSSEVESTRQSEQFQAMKALTGVFGVGVRTADRWFREGIRSPLDLIDTGQKLNHAQQAAVSFRLLGVQYYNDLNTPVTKKEAMVISDIVEKAVKAVLPGAIITLTGGFRRGKEVGHDVDFLITHTEEGAEEKLMPKIVNYLENQGLLLYQKTTRNSYLESKDGPARPPSNMDRFERCFSIFRLEQFKVDCDTSVKASLDSSGTTDKNEESYSGSSWRAVRVDLVVSPYSQFAFATLGWTGSKLFERELRRWAGQEKGMSLSSHALYDSKKQCYFRADSEEEIFSHLGLEYIPPSERNA